MNQNPEVNEEVTCEYYSAECEKDEEGNLIPLSGPVSSADLKEIEGYDLPVHRSLWK